MRREKGKTKGEHYAREMFDLAKAFAEADRIVIGALDIIGNNVEDIMSEALENITKEDEGENL